MTDFTPRWVGPPPEADALSAEYERLAALAGEDRPHFQRAFETKLFTREDGWLSLTSLEDDFHSMRVALRFDAAGVVTEAGGRMLRHPFETCPRAILSLHALVGASVAVPGAHNQVKERMPRTEGCLHIADMLTIAFRAFRISKGHDVPEYSGDHMRREMLSILPMIRDTCISFATTPEV